MSASNLRSQRLLAVLLVALVAPALALSSSPAPASACTVTAGYNPVAASPAVVAGTVVDIGEAPPAELDGEYRVMTIAVDRWLKGDAAGDRVNVLVAAVNLPPNCIYFDVESMLGEEIVTGLKTSQYQGLWTTGWLDTWVVSQGPVPGTHLQPLADLYHGTTATATPTSTRVAPLPPDTGTGAADPGPNLLVPIMVFLIVSGAGAALALRRPKNRD